MRQNVFSTLIVLVAVFPISASGQGTSPATGANETCTGLVYERKNVSQPAEFKVPAVQMTKEDLAKGQRLNVVLSAVLCRTGQVTDIEVSKGEPGGTTDVVVEAIRLMKFKPAESNGQPVSQVMRFNFSFGFIGERHPLAQGPLEGRTINLVEVGGYREELKGEIDECIKLISGNLYDKEQLERVWQKLLELGDFDRQASTLRIEESEMRGGLDVVFELKQKTKH